MRVQWGLALVCAGTVVACEKARPPKVEVIRPVRAEVVEQVSAQRERTFSGSAQAADEARLSFRVTGALRTLHVKMGQKVRKGDVLAELDPADYALQLSEARSTAGVARAQTRNAQSSYERARKLYANNTIPKAQLDQARAAYDSSRAQSHSASQRINLLKRQVDYTKLRAPSDGVVAAVTARMDENVPAGQPVLVLNTGGTLEVVVSVPEALIRQIAVQSAVQIRFDTLPKPVSGTVTEVGVSATGARTTFPVTVTLDALNPAILPGMAAEVTFTFGDAADPERLVAPTVAVGEDGEGRHVFLVEQIRDGQGVVARQGVEIGDVTADGIEIVKGLKGGEVLVTAGLRHIQPGLRVRLTAETLTALAGHQPPAPANGIRIKPVGAAGSAP